MMPRRSPSCTGTLHGYRAAAFTGTRTAAFTGTRTAAFTGTRTAAFTGTRTAAFTGTRTAAFTGTRTAAFTGTRAARFTQIASITTCARSRSSSPDSFAAPASDDRAPPHPGSTRRAVADNVADAVAREPCPDRGLISSSRRTHAARSHRATADRPLTRAAGRGCAPGPRAKRRRVQRPPHATARR